MKTSCLKRFLAAALAAVMVLGLGLSGVSAAPDGQTPLDFYELDASQVSAELKNTENAVEETDSLHEATDEVRVTIVLEAAPALSVMGREAAATSAYRQSLKTAQAQMADRISDQVLAGAPLDVVWNLTLATNAMSANVEYGQVEAIRAVSGVKAVYLEKQYAPMTTADMSNLVAQEMTGASAVHENAGYTGAGSRIAVVDSGTDTDHQSFSQGGYEYALSCLAQEKGLSLEAYVKSLNLLDEAEIASVLGSLNANQRYAGLTADDLYLNSKLPFNFNYVDGSLDVTHDNDTQGEHGSHVAGIATANTYIPLSDKSLYDFNGDNVVDAADAQALLDFAVKGEAIANEKYADLSGNGSVSSYDAHLLLDMLEAGELYISAAVAVGVTGTAPEAQLLTMKVFGVRGGAYASDYIAAVEDAVALGCDVVNLSLGGAYPGFKLSHEENLATKAYVDGVMAGLEESGIVMAVAAGNDGNWADSDDAFQHMYTDEAGTSRASDPGTYANSFTVASADNVGEVKQYEAKLGGAFEPTFEETPDGRNDPWTTLDPHGEGASYDVVFLGDPSNLFAGQTQTDERIYAGNASDFDGYDFTGKVVLIARGNGVYFSDKHMAGAAAGAAAVLIYNNTPGPLRASIAGSTAKIPCGGLSMEDGQSIFALCKKNADGLYETTLTFTTGLHVNHGQGKNPEMSDFSSWGATGNLTMKPEITAPGGNIYSVNGLGKATDQYEVMSGTSMATPHVSGLTALAGQYVRETDVLERAKTGSGVSTLTQRNLIQSLLMSTATPLIEEASGLPYSVRNQGAGLANIENVVNAQSFLLVDGQPDGKVKAELGDGTEGWSFSFTVNNLTAEALAYKLDASILTTDTLVAEEDGHRYNLTADEMTRLGANVTYTGETVSHGQVTVPASGCARVTVTIQVPDKAVENMKALGYTNGFYVEGFVYLNPVADGEGRLGVAHSIPMLGFYGNWTDPSMFDTGSFLETAYGTATRPSHLNATTKNVMTWCPKGDNQGYYYTGNIYGNYSSSGLVGDHHYYSERNAISSLEESPWQLYALFPTLIRNASDVRASITDAETGKVYFVNDYDSFDDYMLGCFYYTNAGQWYDSTSDYGIGFDWDFTDPATGKPVPEGTRLRYTFQCVPDYYVNDDGSVRWDEAGRGTELSYEFTVDNTAPTFAGERPLTLSADGNTLYYTAQDENYIAAVILLNGSATRAVAYSYPDMPLEQKGKAISGGLDLTGFRETYGGKAVIAVCDYAGNETYYAVNLGGAGAAYGDLMAFQNSEDGTGGAWVSFGKGVNRSETGLFSARSSFVCAEYVNGFVFAETDDGNLYGIPYADFLADSIDLESTYIAHLENVYQDLAYSYAQGKLYGLVSYIMDGYPTTEVYSINLNGAYYDEDNWENVEAYQEDWAANRGGLFGLTLACDDEGSLYVMGSTVDEETGETSTAQLWKAQLAESWGEISIAPFKMLGDTGLTMDYLQSMTWDHNTETLYWARFYATGVGRMESTLEQIDPATGECTRVGILSGETSCMFAPLGAEAADSPAHANVPEMNPDVVGRPVLRDDVITMNVGAIQALLYDLDPWYTSHKDVVWCSDNEAVATVDGRGNVTAVSEGSCTITATAKDDPAKSDTCTVQVAALSLSFDGIISAQSAGLGNVSGVCTYNYSMVDGVPAYGTNVAVSWPEEFKGYGTALASSALGRGSLWACEYGNSGMIYEIDPETGVVKDMLEPMDGDVVYGISYAQATDRFNCIMNYFMYVDMPFTHEAEKDIAASYNEETHEYDYHRLNMLKYLEASDKNFSTGENGNGASSDVVFCGITTIPGGEAQELSMDYLGQWSGGSASYTSTLTLVLLDNVGRFWYIDEITDMVKYTDEDGNVFFTDEAMEMVISTAFNGVETVGYDTDGDGEYDTYSVFVLRSVEESPLTAMYLAGTMPRYTYHFSDIEYAGALEDGTPMIALSLYDYWNNGTTNELYLYVPGHETDEWDFETWTKLRTPDRLYDLGDTGEYNIIATIHSASVTGGVAVQEESDETNSLGRGYFHR